MEGPNLFTEAFSNLVTPATKTLQIEEEFELNKMIADKENEPDPVNEENDNSDGKSLHFSCSACKIDFKNSIEQRLHYKLDWHRYNLKQKLRGKDNISEAAYNEQIDDLSSPSGDSSTSEDEDENLNSIATAQGKIFLKNEDGTIFSLYKCLLGVKKEEIRNETLFQKLKELHSNRQWTILMLGGGHFAGVIFKNGEPILHKTFHCYTVRAGQGGSQSSRDNRNATSQPRSAGASLRRYNENALVQHVKDIVETWRDEMSKSNLILYRASGPYNRSVLFGGKTPLLDRTDSRLRTIPFSTKRATFTEVRRVYNQLISINIYKSFEEANLKVIRARSPQKDTKKPKNVINRAKSRETVVRELPGLRSLETSDDNGPVEFELNDVEISFKDLQEFGDSLTEAQRKRGKSIKGNKARNKNCKESSDESETDSENIPDNETKTVTKKKRKPKKKKNQKQRELEENRRKKLIEALGKGDLDEVERIVSEQCKDQEEKEDSLKIDAFYSQILDEQQNTPLHVAAVNDQIECISFLLEKDANPCLKNKKQQTPYTCTQKKETREVFKNFAAANPDKFNYNKAQIPIPVVTTEEAAEKKRLIRKAKREKEKLKKKEMAIKKQEEDAEERFAKLSDREKCALAAERRILNQGGKVTLRCFTCGKDMFGLVPFTYNEYKFCKVDCLKEHRLKNITFQ